MFQENCHIQSFECSQLFGYRSLSQKSIQEDKITALRFDPSGKMLALGDRAGRVIVFSGVDEAEGHPHYEYYFEFQSHEREFDSLKSMPMEEQINHICWFSSEGKYHKMLTSNSNSIKLWKLYEKSTQQQTISQCQQQQQPIISVNLKNTIPNKGCSPLNTLQISHNQQYIFATNEASVLLWSIEHHHHPYLLKQLSPPNTPKAQNNERITCSQLHPNTDNLFILGTNRGALQFNDTRTSISHAHTISFESPKDHSNFLSQIITNYCDVAFIEGTRRIVTRDLISIKIWDMCNNREPLVNEYLDENLKSRLCDLFEADCLEDKFSVSNSRGSIITGNYSNSFHLIDSENGENYQYELDFGQETLKRKVGREGWQVRGEFDSSCKVLKHDFNQQTGQIAVSTHNSFFIFSEAQ